MIRDRNGGWITPPMVDAYVRLHELGWVHSIESSTTAARSSVACTG